MNFFRKSIYLVFHLAMIGASSELYAAQADLLDNLAERLMATREEVERLGEDLRTRKQEHRDRMMALSQQQSELAAAINRDTVATKSLQDKLGDLEQTSKQSLLGNTELKNQMIPLVGEMRKYIESGLPFKKEERLQNIGALEQELLSGKTSPESLVTRFWVLYEGEFSLQREIAEYQQLLVINGKEQLCEVAKLGMVALFYRTPAGDVGRSVKTKDGYSFVSYSGNEEKKMIASLLDSIRKKIRSGYFVLPNFIDREGSVL